MGKLVSISEFARMRKVSHTAVRKAINSGRITASEGPNGKPMIDPEIAGPEWDARTDQSKRREIPEDDERKGPDASASDKKRTSAASAYQIARAIREEYSARSARLDYESRAGMLVPADHVKLQAFQAARLTRDTILNIPNKIAHKLAVETDHEKISNMLTHELVSALEELAAFGRRSAGIEESNDG